MEQDQFVAAQVEAGEAAEKAHAKEIDVERALFGDRGADVSQRDGGETDARQHDGCDFRDAIGGRQRAR